MRTKRTEKWRSQDSQQHTLHRQRGFVIVKLEKRGGTRTKSMEKNQIKKENKVAFLCRGADVLTIQSWIYFFEFYALKI